MLAFCCFSLLLSLWSATSADPPEAPHAAVLSLRLFARLALPLPPPCGSGADPYSESQPWPSLVLSFVHRAAVHLQSPARLLASIRARCSRWVEGAGDSAAPCPLEAFVIMLEVLRGLDKITGCPHGLELLSLSLQ
jgi:hypothetical protein